eukprot:4088980-Prymnesium_polylepis.1
MVTGTARAASPVRADVRGLTTTVLLSSAMGESMTGDTGSAGNGKDPTERPGSSPGGSLWAKARAKRSECSAMAQAEANPAHTDALSEVGTQMRSLLKSAISR